MSDNRQGIMRQFVIMAMVPSYSVKIQFVIEAADWDAVIQQHPDAELIEEIE